MYDPFAPRVNGKPVASWLSVREPKTHARIKKPVASAYSLSGLKEYEPLVDDMIMKFMDRLEESGKGTGTCDMAVWLRLCRFHVIDLCHANDSRRIRCNPTSNLQQYPGVP